MGPQYIGLQKLAVGDNSAGNPAVGRPPGRPANGWISDRCATDRPLGRPRTDPKSRALGRSTARSTGARSREHSSLDGRSPGRPAHQFKQPCTSVHVGRRPSGQPAEGRPVYFLGLKTWFFCLLKNLIKYT